MEILFLPLLLMWHSVACFNLDTRAPVIKQGGEYPDSFFGYSVAQHRNKEGQPVILVGAPQDNNLQPGTLRSGALYKCSVSTSTYDCEQVETDGKRHNSSRMYGIYDGRITDLVPPVSSEIKDGQWLGVSLASQGDGGNVLICAHRYTVRDVDKTSYKPIDSKRAVLGMCYILQSDLTFPQDTSIGAKNVLVVREAMRGKRLELVNDFDNHAKFGVCQVGTSSAWVKSEYLVNQNKTSDYALFGAPGCFTWRGNVFGQKTGTTGSYETAVQDENYLKFTKHGHLGLSVTSGKYFNSQLQFVSGAPHVDGGTGAGEIYFFTLDDLSDSFEVDETRTIFGGSFGAGFGFSLETIDINSDGRDDLLVGAPFCDNKGRGGSVFLYINEGFALDKKKYIEIRGHGPEGQFGLAITRLADINKDGYEDFAVGAPYEGAGVVYIFLGSALGVSGAKVGPGNFIRAEESASQIIKASDFLRYGYIPVPADFSTFGSSLSGGRDMDNNNYPDLLVGSFKSNTAILLLSRPIINVTTNVDVSQLSAIDPGQAGCSLDPDSQKTCFHFKACFRLESDETGIGMGIRFVIQAEPNKPVSRVWMRLKDESQLTDTRSSRVEHELLIQDGGVDECTTILGYLSDTQTDLQTPVKFSLSYSLIQEDPTMTYNEGEQILNVDRFPILNQQQALRTFHANFQKNCGSDDSCQAQLIVRPRLSDRDKELSKSTKGVYELELGTLPDNQFILEVNVQNLGEAAYEAKLDISHIESLSYVGIGNLSDVNAPKVINSTYLSFDLGNPFKGGKSATIQIRFTPHSVINETLITFDFHVNTSSELVVDSSTYLHCLIVRRAELKVSGKGFPSTVFYGGTVRGESALKDVSEIGPLVQHRYLIRNYGPSEVDVVTVKIKWPFQVENNKPQGKWLLYLTDHPVLKNGNGDCTLPAGYGPNPLNLSSKSEHKYSRFSKTAPENILSMDYNQHMDIFIANRFNSESEITLEGNLKKRRRREIEQVVAPFRVKTGEGVSDSELVVRLDCERGTAKCLTITCQMYNLPSRHSVTLEIRSRLWNATLVEDYSHVDRVEIFSKSSVLVDSVYTQDVSNDFESVLTTALPDRQLEPAQTLDWWIYAVAVICGILVLVFIVLILWRLGFFKRKRPLDDDTNFMVSANYEKVKLKSDNDL